MGCGLWVDGVGGTKKGTPSAPNRNETCTKTGPKNHKNHSQFNSKWDPKRSKIEARRVWGALGGGLRAILAPRGAQRPQLVRKAHSRLTLGPPFWRRFLTFFCFFGVFFGLFFRGLFWRVSGSDFEWILGPFLMDFLAFVVRNFVMGRALPNVIWIQYLQYFWHVGVFKNN